jgi:hypothetical protein
MSGVRPLLCPAETGLALPVRVAGPLVGDEEPAMRALEAGMPRRLRGEQLGSEAPMAVWTLHVERVLSLRRLGHGTSVAPSTVRGAA